MKKKIVAEPNKLIDVILFQLGEHTGKIKGRGRPRKKGVKDLADIYAIALATARQEELGVFSYLNKDFLAEIIESASPQAKKKKTQRLFNLAIKLADEANKSIGLDTQKAYEWYKKHGYEELAKEMEQDMKNGYRVFRVSLFVKIADGDKVKFIKVKWSPYLAPFILEIKRGFTLYEIKTFLSLDSIYSKKLYRFLKKLHKYGRVEVPIEEIRFFLEVEDKYRDFYDLEKVVLKPAIEEINKKTDLYVEYTTKREGKGNKVIALIFKIKQKPQEGIKDLEKYLKEKPTEDKLLLEEIKEKIKKLLQELVKEIYTYPVWQFKRLDYYDATGGEIELIDYLLEKFEKVNPATVLWYISHFPQNVDKGKALADALMVEKFEYIDNPEGFLRSKIAFNQKKELKFLLDARVQKLIRNLLEEIKNELTQKEEKQTKTQKVDKQKEEPKEEHFYLEYEPEVYEINQVELNLSGINAFWEDLNQNQKEDFYNNYLKRHPYLELFIRKHFPTLEAFDKEIKTFGEKADKFEEEEEEISIDPWTPVQLARLIKLLYAYITEN